MSESRRRMMMQEVDAPQEITYSQLTYNVKFYGSSRYANCYFIITLNGESQTIPLSTISPTGGESSMYYNGLRLDVYISGSYSYGRVCSLEPMYINDEWHYSPYTVIKGLRYSNLDTDITIFKINNSKFLFTYSNFSFNLRNAIIYIRIEGELLQFSCNEAVTYGRMNILGYLIAEYIERGGGDNIIKISAATNLWMNGSYIKRGDTIFAALKTTVIEDREFAIV